MQEMKNIQTKLITAQTQKWEHQAQIEPLLERVVEVLAQVEEARKQIAQTQLECAGLIVITGISSVNGYRNLASPNSY
jgi:peptidoglycan hydrolase CwlO-like protein